MMEIKYLDQINKLLDNKRQFITDILPANYTNDLISLVRRNKNNYFLQFNFNNSFKKLPHQGFKIHISATLKNYNAILNTIFDYCKTRKICFKYISNLNNLEKNLSGNGKLWSSGKFITIYPLDYSEFQHVIEEIYEIKQLKKSQGIEILSDRRYKDSNNIYYRYGIISGPDTRIYDPNNKNNYYRDYQKNMYYLPSWIKEPFPNNIDDTKKCKLLFNKYIPIKALNNKASGSVFLVKDKDNNKFILKSAKVGYMSSTDTDTIVQQLKKETKNLKRFNDFNFLPKYENDFYEDKDYFLIESIIKGENIDSFRADTRNNFLIKEKRTKTLLRYKAVILDLLKKVMKLHEANIFLGDISANNVLIDIDNNSVGFVDLAQTELIKNINSSYSFYRTSGYFDKRTSYLALKQQDNQQLGYLIMAMFTRANMFLKIDMSGVISYNFFKKYIYTYRLPRAFAKIVKRLIFSNSVNLKDIYNSVLNITELDKEFHIQKEQANFKTILNKTIKTLDTSYIDNLKNKNDKNNSKLNIKRNLIFDDSLLNLRYLYLANENQCITQKEKNKLFLELYKLKKLLINIDTNKKLQTISLANILSLTYCCIKNINTQKQKSEIKEIINIIDNIYKVKDNSTFIGYRMNYQSSYLSPYLEDGTAGVLLNLLAFRKETNIKDFDDEINEIVQNLKLIFMPKCGSFSRGLLGIIFVLNQYRKSFHNKEIIQNIIIMSNRIPYYCLETDNTAYLITSSFDKISLNYFDGNKGLVSVLNNIS